MLGLPSTKKSREDTLRLRSQVSVFVSDSFGSAAHLSVYQNEPRSGEINGDRLHSGDMQRGRRGFFVQQSEARHGEEGNAQEAHYREYYHR